MKHSKQSTMHLRQRNRLAHYSSGEDESGSEEIRNPRNDLKFGVFLHRPVDLKMNSSSLTTLPSKRSRKTVCDSVRNLPLVSRTEPLKSNKFILNNVVPAVGKPKESQGKTSISKKVVGHNIRLRREPVYSSVFNIDNDNEAYSDSDIEEKNYKRNDLVGSNKCHIRDKVAFLCGNQGRRANARCKVLPEIAKEPDIQSELQSCFTRDVHPLDTNQIKCTNRVSNKRNVKNKYVTKEFCNDHRSTNGIPNSRHVSTHGPLDIMKEFKTSEDKKYFSVHYQKVSMILVTVVLLFFLGLGIMYLNVCLKDVNSVPKEHRNVYPVCAEKTVNIAECIDRECLSKVLDILKVLTPHLMSKAVDFYCNTSAIHPHFMSTSDVLEFVIHTYQMNEIEAKLNIQNLKRLVLANTHWAIKLVVDPVEETYKNTTLEYGKFMIEEPVLPVMCQVKLITNKFINFGTLMTAVCVALSGILCGVIYYMRYRERHRRDTYMLINKIITTVRNNSKYIRSPCADGPSYVSVEKCMNEILPRNAGYLLSAWKDAVKYIDHHESRISSEVHTIHGKPTKIWQWLSTANEIPEEYGCRNLDVKTGVVHADSEASPFVPTAHSSPLWNSKGRRNKVWQGQAFETIAGSPNSLLCSPTPCLKIRHMFDPDLEHGRDWPVNIQDAILEKCESICILHMYVDCSSSEGCVFMKCSTPEEAGKAYRALHGWWFDTKLVTVKYLRIERYHERFPEAAFSSKYLRPSNNKKLSLQELWHFPKEST